MAAGLAQLRELERIDGWKLLEDLGAQLEEATRESLGKTNAARDFPSDRLDVLSLLHRRTGDRSGEREAKRSREIRSFL